MSSKKKSTPQKKKKTAEEKEKELDKACEAERNFQKAVDMADGFPPPKSEEDFKFLEKWIFFLIFLFPRKMNPAKISISDCQLSSPVNQNFRKNLFLSSPMPQQ